MESGRFIGLDLGKECRRSSCLDTAQVGPLNGGCRVGSQRYLEVSCIVDSRWPNYVEALVVGPRIDQVN